MSAVSSATKHMPMPAAAGEIRPRAGPSRSGAERSGRSRCPAAALGSRFGGETPGERRDPPAAGSDRGGRRRGAGVAWATAPAAPQEALVARRSRGGGCRSARSERGQPGWVRPAGGHGPHSAAGRGHPPPGTRLPGPSSSGDGYAATPAPGCTVCPAVTRCRAAAESAPVGEAPGQRNRAA